MKFGEESHDLMALFWRRTGVVWVRRDAGCEAVVRFLGRLLLGGGRVFIFDCSVLGLDFWRRFFLDRRTFRALLRWRCVFFVGTRHGSTQIVREIVHAIAFVFCLDRRSSLTRAFLGRRRRRRGTGQLMSCLFLRLCSCGASRSGHLYSRNGL